MGEEFHREREDGGGDPGGEGSGGAVGIKVKEEPGDNNQQAEEKRPV